MRYNCFCFDIFRQRQQENEGADNALGIVENTLVLSLQQVQEAFQYNKLSTTPQAGEYSSFHFNEFFNLCREQENITVNLDGGTVNIKPAAIKGYKLHVAISDADQSNLANGWNIVKNILIEKKIIASKVVRPGRNLIENPQQRGKQITIYCSYNYNIYVDWAALCQEITMKLSNANITPAHFSSSDAPIKGSHYLSYRSDLNDNNYQFPLDPTKRERQGLDIINKYFKRILEDIEVTVENQPAYQIQPHMDNPFSMAFNT